MTNEERSEVLRHIEVEKGYLEGKEIEYRRGIDCVWYTLRTSKLLWNWAECDYRIKPEPEREYVDLGLPSGTLWAVENEEGYYTFDEANDEFKENMPSKEDFKELVRECFHRWNDELKGIEFLSPYNGNTIFFPASGYRSISIGSMSSVGIYGYNWSSSPDNSVSGYNLTFNSVNTNPSNTLARTNSLPVRCVEHRN